MGITTKDVLAVMVVGAVMVFAGVSQATGQPLDAGTFGMAGLIIGHYFSANTQAQAVASAALAASAVMGATAAVAEPLPEPYIGDADGR